LESAVPQEQIMDNRIPPPMFGKFDVVNYLDAAVPQDQIMNNRVPPPMFGKFDLVD